MTMSPTSAPSPGKKLMTPGGNPASSKSSIPSHADSSWVLDGFQMLTLPIIAGAVGRFKSNRCEVEWGDGKDKSF